MSPLVMVWFLFASLTVRGIHYDLQSDYQLVRLFKQTDYGYTTYIVTVKPN